jgi:AraC family transcriptional regulator, ethanolamine operon transcriptional activator
VIEDLPMDCGMRFPDSASSRFVATSMMRIESHDTDQLSEALLDWNTELTQLHPGPFEGNVTVIPLGPVLICRARFNQSLLQHHSTPDDCVTICRPGRGSDPLAVRGHDLRDGDVFLAGPAGECEAVNRGLHFPSTVSIKVDFLQSQSHWLRSCRLPHAGSVQLHSAGRAWTNSFLDAVEWVVDAASRYPNTVTRTDVSGSLVDTLLDRVDILRAAESPLSEGRELRAARRFAVERAREYIRVNLTEPIRLSELCRYARTQARSLEYGFREALGISPIAYIRATRLHRVRRLLRSTAVCTRSISEIALDCGFWHLSQFAVDYKQLFAESPSTTYGLTQAQLPRVARRREPPVASPFGRRLVGFVRPST